MKKDIENSSSSFEGEKAIRQWIDFVDFIKVGQPPEIIIENIIALEQNNMFSNLIVIVYNTRNFSTLHVSESVNNILGFSQQEIMKNGLLFNGNTQAEFLQDLMKWGGHFRELKSEYNNAITKSRGYYGGRVFAHKDGSLKRFLMRHEVNHMEYPKVPEVDVLILEEATHLIKENEYWMLLQKYTDTDMYQRFYSSHGIDKDLLSSREKEILTIIAEGKSSKEIADLLQISIETVSQHRKNMIKRASAKNASALVQICKICEII